MECQNDLFSGTDRVRKSEGKALTYSDMSHGKTLLLSITYAGWLIGILIIFSGLFNPNITR